MKRDIPLVVASLVSIALLMLHIVDDVARNISPAGIDNMTAVVIFAVLLYATLMLADRRSGLVIMLIGGLFAAAMPVLHLRGARIGTIATGDGGYFFIWTLFAVGSTGLLTMALATRALWLRRQAPTI